MFQKISYDPVTIDRELQMAQSIGFRSLRIFLHDLLWKEDSDGFLKRLEDFFDLAAKRGFSIMPVLLDSCWQAHPKLGVQPEPTPGVHNSQWVQCPGYDIIHDNTQFDKLQDYVKGVVTHFKNDTRIVAWDVWNEPNNSGYADETIVPLMKKVVSWVRDVDPSQPITTAIWQNVETGKYNELQQLQLDSSDILSFHNYDGIETFKGCVEGVKRTDPGRPVYCTEYMGRTSGSVFDTHLKYMKEEGVDAMNWGLVSGKTNTIYNYKTNTKPDTVEPTVWFHDIFRVDGSPYDAKEVDLIKEVTGSKYDKILMA